jgi:hypothetical protein
MKRLFSITPKDEKGGEVTEVFLAEKQASDVGFGGVRRGHRLCCLTRAAPCRCEHQTRWWSGDRRVVSASVGGGVSYSRGGVALSARRTLTLASGDEHQTRPSTERENGPLWTASVGATDARFLSDRRVCWLEIDRWNFDCAGHVACIRATDARCRVCCKGDRRVCCPRKTPSEGATTIFVCGVINRSGDRAWLSAEHTLALVAYVVVLVSPLTHSCLIVFIGSSERAILV